MQKDIQITNEGTLDHPLQSFTLIPRDLYQNRILQEVGVQVNKGKNEWINGSTSTHIQ